MHQVLKVYIMKYRVKELVKKSGMTLESFAESLGYSRQNLTKTLSNNPTIGTLERIANALNVEVSELFAPKDDFIAFVRANGETQTFTRMCDLLYWIHGIERADNLDQ